MSQKRAPHKERKASAPPKRSPIVMDSWVRYRMMFATSLLMGCLGGIGYKAYTLQVLQSETFREVADKQHLKTIELPAPRGAIYDADGAELATNAYVDSLHADPRKIVDVAGSAKLLAGILDIDARELEAKLASTRYFVWLKRHISPAQAKRIRAINLPGVYLTPEPRRFYPGGNVAGPVIGFSGIDGNGLDGLELKLDTHLTGEKAKLTNLRDATGALMVSDPSAKAIPGASVYLTLKRPIQSAADSALRKAVATHQADAGIAVVMDVKTGDVLAMANYPSYDPNSPAHAKSMGARNRAVTDTYESGSVMKVFSIAAALDAQVVQPETIVQTHNGSHKFGRKRVTDSFRDDFLTIGGILKRSSNIGAAKVGLMTGARRLHEALTRFGFGQKTHIELPGEQRGILRPYKSWREIDTATTSYGYAMSATPLQVTAAMASVANGGMYNTPRIIKSIEDEKGKLIYQRKVSSRRVLAKETAADLLPMLESVFESGKKHGTASKMRIPGFRLGGKTGTAHKYIPEEKAYADHRYLSSFSGIAPINDPRVAVFVLIDDPHGKHHYGATVAGKAWTEITGAALHHLSIEPDDALLKVAQANVDDTLTSDPFSEDDNLYLEAFEANARAQALELGTPVIDIPDFRGKSLAKVLAMARKEKLPILVEGSGKSVKQSPPPGYALPGASVRVTFDRL